MATTLLVLSSGLGACSLFVDTSDLSGGVEAADAAPFDAATDVAVNDAGGTADAAFDAPFVFSCDATLCESFDLQAALPGNWTVSSGDAGTVAVVPEGRSLPNALAATAPVGVKVASFSVGASFSKTMPAFRLELDMFLDAIDGSPGAEVDLFDVVAKVDGSTHYSLYVGAFDGAWSIAEYASLSDGGQVDNQAPLTLAPPTGRWTHVLFVSDGSTISVSFDGVVDGTLTGLASFAQASGVDRTLDVGFPYLGKTTEPLRIRVDNIAFTP